MNGPEAGSRGPRNHPVDRRTFLRYSAYTGALAAATPALAGLPSAAEAAPRGATVRGAAVRPRLGTRTPAFEWEEATIAQLQRAMQSGELTSVRLVQDYVRRIQALDWDPSGPQLNSVMELNPDALAIAAEMDRERKLGHIRGPLHGIPLLLKDNIGTNDRMETTAGSFALLGSRVPRDAFVVHQLRKAGAVIQGKLNLSEWANFRSLQSSSGWSGRAGQCLNPYVLDHNPCGSSSGSGASISGNLGVVSLGTETDGSIVCPASNNAVVGIKPTLGLTSRSGVVPLAHSQDVTGPMGRTVADAATVLGPMTGVDPRDPITFRSIGHSYENYRQFLDPRGLAGARIGVWRQGVFGLSPEADRIAEDAIAEMSRLGATIVDPADIPNVVDVFNPEFVVLLFEFKHDLNRYLGDLVFSAVRTLEECIQFNRNHANVEMPWFGQEIFQLAQLTDGLNDPRYRKALKFSKRTMRQAINDTMDRFDLDAIVSITDSPPWTTDLVNGDHFLTSSSTPAAVAGFPSISVPAGYTHEDLPVGISFIGREWGEPTLIKLTSGFEAGTQIRHAPRFIPSLGVKDFVPRGVAAKEGGSEATGVAEPTTPARPRPIAWPLG